MRIIIYCAECTKKVKFEFYSLSAAILHVNQYQHEVKIEIEPEYEDE